MSEMYAKAYATNMKDLCKPQHDSETMLEKMVALKRHTMEIRKQEREAWTEENQTNKLGFEDCAFSAC